MGFDSKAETWDNDPEKHKRAEAFACELAGYSGSALQGSALDFGCGTGLVSFFLRERLSSIVLADTSEGMIRVLEKKISDSQAREMIPYLIKPGGKISSSDNFDLIYTLLALHHVDDIGKTISEFARMLKKGGLLFIGDLVTEDGSFHMNDAEFNGHKGFDPEVLAAELKKNEFEIIASKLFYTITRETDAGRKDYPLFILGGKLK